MCVQNKNFGFVFGTFLAPVWPIYLEIARCKTTVNLLSYGIGIDLLKGGSYRRCAYKFLGQTDGQTDRPKSLTLYPSASRGIIWSIGASAAETWTDCWNIPWVMHPTHYTVLVCSQISLAPVDDNPADMELQTELASLSSRTSSRSIDARLNSLMLRSSSRAVPGQHIIQFYILRNIEQTKTTMQIYGIH